jgi:hypothetical protein
MPENMSDASDIAESNRGGRFVNGGKPGPGRPRGARSKLGEQFVEDLRSVWETHGKQALIDCAENEPAQFVRVLAGLMPRDININATLDVTTFANNFRHALELLGNEPALPKPRRPMRVINNAG